MEIYPILWLIVAIISLIPVYIFWIGYRKLQTRDLFITAIAFTLFFIKALTLSIALFEINDLWYANDEFWLAIAAILDIIIIGLIAFSFSNRFNPQQDIEKSFPLEDGEDEQEKGISNDVPEGSTIGEPTDTIAHNSMIADQSRDQLHGSTDLDDNEVHITSEATDTAGKP